MRDNKVEIPRQNIITKALYDVALKYHLESYPLIVEDIHLMTMMALRQLQQMHERPMDFSAEIYVPFRTYNFPEPTTQA